MPPSHQVLQTLLDAPGESRLSVLVLTPTRELAFQIREQFQALGSSIGLSCACITGGMEMISQQLALAKKPHVVIATPGRLIDHLEKTKGETQIEMCRVGQQNECYLVDIPLMPLKTTHTLLIFS